MSRRAVVRVRDAGLRRSVELDMHSLRHVLVLLRTVRKTKVRCVESGNAQDKPESVAEAVGAE